MGRLWPWRQAKIWEKRGTTYTPHPMYLLLYVLSATRNECQY